MRALSIRQPWHWAILKAGKYVENRLWPACHYRGPMLLHIAQGCTRQEYEQAVATIHQARRELGLPPIQVPPLAELPRGGLGGIARITGAEQHDFAGMRGYRAGGQLGLNLARVRELPFVPMKGALSFFPINAADLGEHRGAYEGAWKELDGCAG